MDGLESSDIHLGPGLHDSQLWWSLLEPRIALSKAVELSLVYVITWFSSSVDGLVTYIMSGILVLMLACFSE